MLLRKFINAANLPSRGNKNNSNPSRFEIKTLSKCPLFDETYYRFCAQAAGLPTESMDPVVHYITIGDKRHISTHPLFDTRFYREHNKDIKGSGMSALFHFIRHGARELRSPHPFIDPQHIVAQIGSASENYLLDYLNSPPGTVDPHPMIDETYLFQQRIPRPTSKSVLLDFYNDATLTINPSPRFDIAAYATSLNGANHRHPFFYYLASNKLRNLDSYNLEANLTAISTQIDEIADLEPSLDLGKIDAVDIRVERAINYKQKYSDVLRDLLALAGSNSADFLYLVRDIGSSKFADFLKSDIRQKSSAGDNPNILVFITDAYPEYSNDRFFRVHGVRTIYLKAMLDALGRNNFPETLSVFLQLIPTKHVCVIESDIGWDLIEKYGRQLSRFVKFHAFVPDYDLDYFGRKSGYAWTHLPECAEHLTTISTDCASLASTLRTTVEDLDGSKSATKVILSRAPMN
jgi:hypothetical protein